VHLSPTGTPAGGDSGPLFSKAVTGAGTFYSVYWNCLDANVRLLPAGATNGMSLVESLDEAVRNRRHEVSETVTKQFHSSIRAVLVSEDGTNPRIIGSCMLLRVDDRNYVVTAAHIADELGANALYISGTVGAELVQLVGVIRKTAPPPGGRWKDKIDIAFWEIDTQNIRALGDVEFIDESQFSKNRAPLKNRLYLAAGYPFSRNKKNVNNVSKSIKTSLSKYTAELTENPAVAQEYDVSGTKHLFLKYQKFSETGSGEKQTTFSPVGLSGGPLIDLGNFASLERYIADSKVTGYIAGMTIERIRKHNVLVAVRIQVIVEAIRLHGAPNPALRRSLEP
jgi:hypothetical protein